MLVNIPAPWILWVCSYSLHSCRVLQCIYCWCSIKKHVSACDEIATRRNLEQQITVSGRSAVGDIFWLSFRERFGLSLHLAGSRKQWCWETVLLEHFVIYIYICMLIYVECFLIYCLGQGLPGETATSEPRLWQLKPQRITLQTTE